MEHHELASRHDPVLATSNPATRSNGHVPRPATSARFEVRRAAAAWQASVSTLHIFPIIRTVQFMSQGMDVRPHPANGLANRHLPVDGRIMHRDSEGISRESSPRMT